MPPWFGRRQARPDAGASSGPPRALGRMAVAGAAIVALAGLGVIAGTTGGGPSATSPSPSPTLAAGRGSSGPTASAIPSPSPTPSASPSPSPSPSPALVAATTDGILLPADQAALATQHVIAVMIDDKFLARPQSGLAQADIVYQAPAEGGIPRYMALFQTQSPPAIGPVRSSRLYFVAWAEEWRALYVHAGGAPNALAELRAQNGQLIYDGDEFRWGGGAGYLWRITTRFPPHNVYSSGDKLRALAQRVGATAPQAASPWTFVDDPPPGTRPAGGTIAIPYLENRISYAYDRATDRYLRSVSGASPQVDVGTDQTIAPASVVILRMSEGRLQNAPGQPNNVVKGRLDIGYLGSGQALVFTG